VLFLVKVEIDQLSSLALIEWRFQQKALSIMNSNNPPLRLESGIRRKYDCSEHSGVEFYLCLALNACVNNRVRESSDYPERSRMDWFSGCVSCMPRAFSAPRLV